MLWLKEMINITFLKSINIKDINLLSINIFEKIWDLNYFKTTSILINQPSFDSHLGHFHRL